MRSCGDGGLEFRNNKMIFWIGLSDMLVNGLRLGADWELFGSGIELNSKLVIEDTYLNYPHRCWDNQDPVRNLESVSSIQGRHS